MSDSFDPRAFIAQAPWRFAKSMPHLPHWYVRQGDVAEQDFKAFLTYMERHGFRARWRHLPANSYLELDGWRYWTMPGRGEPSITIINRERLPGQPLRRVE
jgi:hypothetical protein